jgi:hypothetical protein
MDKILVGTETLCWITHFVEQVAMVIFALEHTDLLIGRRALGRYPAHLANLPAKLRWFHQLTVTCACRRGDALVDQRAAEIVGAGEQSELR